MVERKEIEHIAVLARLDAGADTERLAGDMQAIIGMVDKLSELELKTDSYPLDLTNVNAFREDEIKPSLSREEVLFNAPDVEAGCVSVPKMLGTREE